MNFSENEFRDFLFENYKENLSSIIIGKRDSIIWDDDSFPPIHILLQQIAEKKINEILESLECLILTAKELRLEKSNDSTTRVDLFGNSELGGLTIIELKKSKKTERESFTELLAYTNYFCSIFSGLNENSITSVLIAPMETRTVRDSYFQELVMNKKKTLVLIPKEKDGKITLKVYYPDNSYYLWFENNLFKDTAMSVISFSFPVIEGYIDTDFNTKDREIPKYSKEALNVISSTVSHKLESLGFHSLVYSSQRWGELAQKLPYPNTVFVVSINPFSSFIASISNDETDSNYITGRVDSFESVSKQLGDDESSYWIESN